MRRHRIYLWGMPGSGKSRLGKSLAKRLAWDFIDTDRLVEKRAGLKVAEIFKRHGESQFRRLELQALRQASRRSPCVIATGGGMVLSASNRRFMKNQGLTFYLRVPLAALAERLSGAEARRRPLLRDGLQSLRQLAKARAPFYSEAEFSVRVDASPEVALERVWRKIKTQLPSVLSDRTAR